MTGYCVSDIAAITGGVLSGDGAAPVTGAVIDSRAVTPGALFAAIPGERVDGHDYIGKAFDRLPRSRRLRAPTAPALPSPCSA